MEVPKLSKSRILQYCNCPQQYKLVQLNDVPFTSPAMQAGTWFHDIAEKFFNRLDYGTMQPKNFENTLKSLMTDISWRAHKDWMDNFIKIETERFNRLPRHHYRPKHKEVKLKIGPLSGIIDRVDYEPKEGRYHIYDYKTGTVQGIKKHLFEMTVYAYLFREAFKKPIPKVGIIAVKTGKILSIDITEEHINKMLGIVKQVKKSITMEYFPIKPKNCFWCPQNVKKLCHENNKGDWEKHLLEEVRK